MDNPEQKPADEGYYQQELQHTQISARVPEAIGRGVFSTGAIVMNGPHDFVIDFLMNLAPPHRVASRVILPPTVLPLFIAALSENLNKFQQHFGAIPKLPPPPPGTTAPPVSEVYEKLKLPDEMLCGVYANTVMIVHNPAEFCFDFITSFFPRSSVSARVFLAAPHVPQLLESLNRAWEQYRRKFHRPPEQPRPPEPDLSS